MTALKAVHILDFEEPPSRGYGRYAKVNDTHRLSGGHMLLPSIVSIRWSCQGDGDLMKEVTLQGGVCPCT